ncbi:MAG TPA: hypothetical protein VGS19_29045 [Streptosporangiaceae bacterium]|nr:hypothetical protein [Streptosporangiaceae bacterium]
MALDMDPGVRAQWCAALRSGEYKQTKGTLRGETPEGDEGYCCLGVLTDLYVKAGNPEAFELQDGDCSVAGVWDCDILTDQVKKWAGLTSADPELHFSGGSAPAAELNDDGTTFAEIADLIDGGVA